LYDFWVRKTRSRMTDPKKRDIVAPLDQFEWFGATRVNLEMDYYEMLDRPNVKLIDLKKTPIQSFDRQGIVTKTPDAITHHDMDIVIMATGYDSLTGSLLDMNIRDKHGVQLRDAWKNGISTYLGMMVPNMPNAFVLYGPQGPTTQTNAPPFIELQVDWVVSLLERMREDGLRSIEPSEESCRSWKSLVMDVFESTLFRDSTAWWTGANIPHKNIEPLVFLVLSYPGSQGWVWVSRKDPKLSVRAAAKIYQVSRVTLTRRLNGTPSRRDTMPNSRNLTLLEEEKLVNYILDLDARSFPPRITGVEEMANYLLADRDAPPVGKHWALNFVKRQP
ncbi:cyclopentanone-monooxygenase, partial [Colletotrichum incanum]